MERVLIFNKKSLKMKKTYTNIKVALCASGEIYGGVEQFIYSYSNYLKKESKIKFIVVLFNRGLLYDKLNEAGIETYLFLSQKYNPLIVKQIANLLKKKKINIVHTHGYKANILCSIAAKMNNAKIVKTEHGKQEPSKGMGYLKMSMNLFLDKIVTKYMCDSIVFVSKDIQKHFNGAYPHNKQYVIYNGIEPISIVNSKGAEEIDDKYFNIGIIGRISEVKGHLYLLKAMTMLNHIDDLRLYIFGEGPLKKTCEDYCNSNGIAGKVYFMGFKNNIYDYMSKLDLLVMPSLHEGLPYTILEAMSLKVPVIASDIGGLKEVIKNNEDGILVPPKDIEALTSVIEYLHQHKDIRENLTKNACNKVCSQFSIEYMTDKYLDIYSESI